MDCSNINNFNRKTSLRAMSMISSNQTHILHLNISIMFLQWWYGVVWLLPKLVLVTQLQYLLIGVLMSGWYFKGKWHYLDLCLIDNSMCIAKKGNGGKWCSILFVLLQDFGHCSPSSRGETLPRRISDDFSHSGDRVETGMIYITVFI